MLQALYATKGAGRHALCGPSYVMVPPHCRHTAHAKLLTRNGNNTFAVSMLLYWIVNKLIPMRVSSESERIGLDMSQHGESYNFADMEDEVNDDGQLRY